MIVRADGVNRTSLFIILLLQFSLLPGLIVFPQSTAIPSSTSPSSQAGTENSASSAPVAPAVTPAGGNGAEPIPDGFRKIRLGMGLDEVKSLLMGDSYFLFRGDPDVSLLQEPNTTLIECRGSFFIERAFFQFHRERLYIIILALNQEQIDHYALYTTLTGKYGKPSEFSPAKAVWRTGDLEFSLERPLTVKYVSRAVFDERNAAGRAEESLMEISRDEFLEQF